MNHCSHLAPRDELSRAARTIGVRAAEIARLRASMRRLNAGAARLAVSCESHCAVPRTDSSRGARMTTLTGSQAPLGNPRIEAPLRSSVDLQRTLRRGQPVTVASVGKRPRTPAGVPEISRGSSEATPPDMKFVVAADPGGVAAALSARFAPHSDRACRAKISRDFEACRISCGAGTPAGVQSHFPFRTGGVASLNPRLIAVTPTEVNVKSAARTCAGEVGTKSTHSRREAELRTRRSQAELGNEGRRFFRGAASVGQLTRAHDMVRDDPCHLAWQVRKIPWLDSLLALATRPLPARPAGESDSDADDFQIASKSPCCSKAKRLAANRDRYYTNPKRQRGNGLTSSLALRVGVISRHSRCIVAVRSAKDALLSRSERRQYATRYSKLIP